MKLFRNLKALTRWAIRNNETGPSSNGRTLVFGTSYVGSNPGGPASLKNVSALILLLVWRSGFEPMRWINF